MPSNDQPHGEKAGEEKELLDEAGQTEDTSPDTQREEVERRPEDLPVQEADPAESQGFEDAASGLKQKTEVEKEPLSGTGSAADEASFAAEPEEAQDVAQEPTTEHVGGSAALQEIGKSVKQKEPTNKKPNVRKKHHFAYYVFLVTVGVVLCSAVMIAVLFTRRNLRKLRTWHKSPRRNMLAGPQPCRRLEKA